MADSPSKSTAPTQKNGDGSAPPADGNILNRVIKRFGGRHLIFRTQLGKWRVFPKPYALVSTFRGPVWFFYGIGQIWITHRKYHEFDGWMARLPRIWRPRLAALVDELEPALIEFTHYCNEQGFEGTIVIDPDTIEFHWTFGFPLQQEKDKREHADLLDQPFQRLVEAFLSAKQSLGLGMTPAPAQAAPSENREPS